jgi:hypothetical protein
MDNHGVFWEYLYNDQQYMSLTESCLLEISTYPSTVVSVPPCPALISLYSQDARLPSSPVTYAPVRWPTPALREAVIFSLGGWMGRSISYQESIVPFVYIAILIFYLIIYSISQFIFYKFKKMWCYLFPGTLGDVDDIMTAYSNCSPAQRTLTLKMPAHHAAPIP